MAVASKRLRTKEAHSDPLIAKLEVVCWAVLAFGRYTMPSPLVSAPVAVPALIIVLHEC